MCEKGKNLSVTVDTSDEVALLELGRMFAAIADARIEGRYGFGVSAAGAVAFAKSELGAGGDGDYTREQVQAAADAFNQVENAAGVDAGAAFAHAHKGPGAAGPTAGLGELDKGGQVGPTAQEQPPTPGQAQAGAAAGISVERDKNGLPWDARINTSNRAQTKQGVWKRAPGLTDEFYNGILAELRATMNNAPPQPGGTAVSMNELANMGVAGPAAAPPPPAGAGPAQPPAPGPAGPGAADPAAEPVPTNFSDFLAAVSKRTTSNPPKLTKAEMDTCLQIVGATHGCALNTLADLNVRPDLIPAAYAQFANVWNGR